MTDFDAEDFEVNLKRVTQLLRDGFEQSKYCKISVVLQDGRIVHIGEDLSHEVQNRAKDRRK